jgi:hypothetical protein
MLTIPSLLSPLMYSANALTTICPKNLCTLSAHRTGDRPRDWTSSLVRTTHTHYQPPYSPDPTAQLSLCSDLSTISFLLHFIYITSAAPAVRSFNHPPLHLSLLCLNTPRYTPHTGRVVFLEQLVAVQNNPYALAPGNTHTHTHTTVGPLQSNRAHYCQ